MAASPKVRTPRAHLARTLALCLLLAGALAMPFTARGEIPAGLVFVVAMGIAIPTIVQVQRGWTRYLWASRIERLREKSTEVPSDPELHCEFAVMSSLHGDPVEARAAFEKALAIVPGHAGATVGLGHLDAQDGNLDGALERFTAAAAQHPDSFAAHYGMAGVYLRQEKYARAIQSYEKALALEEDDAFTLAELARCHLLLGDPERAEEYRVRAAQQGMHDAELERLIRAASR